jgi:hypothetical protein
LFISNFDCFGFFILILDEEEGTLDASQLFEGLKDIMKKI